MNNHFYYKKIYKIFIYSLLVLIISCSKKEVLVNNSSPTKNDSILYWVNEEGRNIDLPLDLRRKALKKAYDSSEKLNNDSLKTKYFSNISLAYLNLPDSTLFRKLNNRTMDLCRITKDTIAHAEVHWDLATFFQDYKVLDSSYYNYKEALRIYLSIEDEIHAARMLYNMALVQEGARDYTGSEINTVRAIELIKPYNQYRRLYSYYNLLGNIALSLKEYDKALEYHQQALEYLNLTSTKDRTLEPMTQLNLGNVYQEQNQHQKASHYFKTVLANDSLFFHNPDLYAKALTNLAVSTIKLDHNSAEPLNLLKKAIRIQDSLENIKGLSIIHYGLSEYYLNKADTATAVLHLKESKTLAEQSKNYERLLKTLQLLPNIDSKNAALYAQQYFKLNDSLQQEDRRIRDKFARIRFETNEFIEQNELLDQQKSLWFGIAVTSLLLGVLLFVIIFQRIKTQKLEFQQSQQQSNEEIFNLMLSQKEKVEEGKHLEQKRISEELHDGILGQMLGIRLILSGLNKKTGDDVVEKREGLIKKLQGVEEEIRTISHELNHNSYEKVTNFILSIQDLLQTIGESGNISYDFVYNEDMEWDQLHGDIKINLYRVVQECLQNCLKHAEASNISVNFNVEANTILVHIKDDGKGFIANKRRKGIGLKNITSRMKKLQGSYKIDSEIGKGTIVTLTIPIDPNMI
ncbi:signal transduction histidine kinase [Saonia flava]|uniref:histidine kinase n=1 Tax=Saonia flava TaxID=523696 RepID=A0A846QVJ0_9FLAO|nr:tetratricopeptide repeat protein [Saonia flava]NJB69585.1 signal transduction histidine kinase [Saonia flava]